VLGFQIDNRLQNGAIGAKIPSGLLDRRAMYWATNVKVPPLLTSFTYPMTTVEIPLAKMTWDKIGAEKMAEIFQQVQDGDITALRSLIGYPVMLDAQYSDNYTK
jgi:hypothetical protein